MAIDFRIASKRHDIVYERSSGRQYFTPAPRIDCDQVQTSNCFLIIVASLSFFPALPQLDNYGDDMQNSSSTPVLAYSPGRSILPLSQAAAKRVLFLSVFLPCMECV